MNDMYLVLGDWSDDGHGKYEKVLLRSNKTPAEIQEAYRKSCAKVQVQFHGSGQDLTGRGLAWNTGKEKYEIACEYESNDISPEAAECLKNAGIDLDDIVDGDADEGYSVWGCDAFTKLWIAFVSLSLEDGDILEETEETNKIPTINGYWGDLNVGFGYGLFH